MSVLGKLALSQIRQKKVRTTVTVLAMVLSSALLTAVVNFVVSGNAMLVGFLGEDYGEYGGAYTLLLLIPAAVLGILIVSMSVIVISNVFRMSASERIAEFGTLKCVGATGEQIGRTIMYECFFLCVLAIPVGVLLGYLFSFLGIGAANSYMDELNVLTRSMMLHVTFTLSFVFSPVALLVSVVISAGTVFFSAMLPARKAMKISALECIRNGGRQGAAACRRAKGKLDGATCERVKGKLGGVTCGHGKGRLSGKRGIEYELARKNAASHHKKMKSAVTAFSFSIILFVTMSGLKEIADGVSDYISVDYGYTVMADYTSNYEFGVNEKTGRRECHYVQTIGPEQAEEITEKLAAWEGNEVFGMGQDYYTYMTFLKEPEITEELAEVLAYEAGENEQQKKEKTGGEQAGENEQQRERTREEQAEEIGQQREGIREEQTGEKGQSTKETAEKQAQQKAGEQSSEGTEKEATEYEIEVELITVDEKHYRELCTQTGAAQGDAILVNDYKYNDHGTERHIVPLPVTTSSLQLEKADGSTRNVEIGGMLFEEEMPREFMYPNVRPVRLILPSEEVRGYNWMSSPKDEEGYMAYAKEILEEYFPQGDLDYGEAGYVCRVFGTQDYSKIMNIAVVIAFFFLYGFVLLLGLIGILNVMSTEMFQVRMRAREFAVLRSIGMTSEDLEKMLHLESVLCAGRALVTGLPVGVLLVLLMKYCVQKLLPFSFHMPWGTIAAVIFVSFAFMWGTVRVSLHTLKNQNLIETIRM